MTDQYHSSLTTAAGIGAALAPGGPKVIGILGGEGVGPQLTGLCVELLGRVADRFGHSVAIEYGGPIGLEAFRKGGNVLSDEVCGFCQSIFDRGGGVLAGPGGGRFVYDMRRRFDLFLKLNPLQRHPELDGDTRVHWRTDAPVDVIVVRENMGGLYQGHSTASEDETGLRVEHRFAYSESEVARVVDPAARLAASRRRHLTVIAKDAGLPDLTRLWFECARRAARRYEIELRTLDIDFAVYAFMSAPEDFDVVALPNCFGDIIADLGGVVCGSRGATFGASYSETGAAVYQTNHGSAYDLAGTDSANPVGQILALAMMLRETYGLGDEADAIVGAVRDTWRAGWRTADLMVPGRRLVGTADFVRRVMDRLSQPADADAAA